MSVLKPQKKLQNVLDALSRLQAVRKKTSDEIVDRKIKEAEKQAGQPIQTVKPSH